MKPDMTSTWPNLLVCVMLGSAGPASGQAADPAEPTGPSPGAAERRDEAAALVPRAVSEDLVIAPEARASATSTHPGLTRGVDWLRGLAELQLEVTPPRLLPEHSFLSGRRGEVRSGPFGTYIFIPDPDAALPGERAMLLLPNRVTQRIAAGLGHGGPVAVEISGEVFVYHERNYVLPSTFRDVPKPAREPVQAAPAAAPTSESGGEAAPAAQGTAGDAPAPAAPVAAAATPAEADVTDLIAELRAQRGQAAPQAGGEVIEASDDLADDEGSREAEAALPSAPLHPEGELITLRRGRIDRDETGSWVFLVENDADPAGDRRSFVLLPCRTLMRIEAAAEREGDLRAVRLSGRATVYRGKNFLLPQLFTLERVDDVRPLQ